MTVGAFFVRGLFPVVQGIEHHEIGDEIRKGMHAIGDQRLGVADDPDNDLRDGQNQIPEYAYQGHTPARLITWRAAGVDGVVFVRFAHVLPTRKVMQISLLSRRVVSTSWP